MRYLGARPLVGEEALRLGQGGAGPSGNCLLLSLESGLSASHSLDSQTQHAYDDEEDDGESLEVS